MQRSKQSSLSDSTAEKVQQNKLHNNNRPIFIDENDDEFEGSGRKGEVSHILFYTLNIFLSLMLIKSFSLIFSSHSKKKVKLLFNSTHVDFN